MQGKWKTKSDAGSCNFCTNATHRVVFEFMRDEGGGTLVRICKNCLKELKRISK